MSPNYKIDKFIDIKIHREWESYSCRDQDLFRLRNIWVDGSGQDWAEMLWLKLDHRGGNIILKVEASLLSKILFFNILYFEKNILAKLKYVYAYAYS